MMGTHLRLLTSGIAFPKLRTAGPSRLSVLASPRISPEAAVLLRRVLKSKGFADSSKEDSPALITLRRLFVRAESVPADEAAQALSPLDPVELVRAGLLAETGGRFRSLLQAQSYQGLILFSDFWQDHRAGDYVLQVGAAGNYLARLTMRKPVETALDLGCGCGVQSLLTARHVTQVTATDLNPRALALTLLNADLNGVANIETLEGSFFEPVAGRAFDLILANLPYVITPENKMLFRDAVLPGDAGLRNLIRDIPAHLTEGGYAQLLANWIHGKDEAWCEPLKSMVKGRGLDAWLIYNGSKDPEEYAAMWLEGDPRNGGRKYDRAKNAWLKWYRERGIERIAMGVVILRRRASASNWVCAAEVTKSLETPAGEQLVWLFEAQDYLASLPDKGALLEEILMPLEVDIHPAAGAGNPKAVSTSGLYLQADLQPATAEVIRHLDGRTRLREAIQKSGVEGNVLDDIRSLLSLGMLAPVSNMKGLPA